MTDLGGVDLYKDEGQDPRLAHAEQTVSACSKGRVQTYSQRVFKASNRSDVILRFDAV